MSENIIVLKGQSRYNVLRIAADYMIESFRKRGFNVLEFDLTIEGIIPEFIQTVSTTSCILLFSFQALLFDLCLTDDKPFLNTLNFPIFGHIVDHPIYHSLRLSSIEGANIYLGCIDSSHVDYVKKYYSNIKHVTYLPHGGFNPNTIIPYNERTIDLFFPCSYAEPNEIMNQINKLPEVYQNMCKIIIKNMLNNPLLNLQDALYEYLDSVHFVYENDEFTLIMDIMSVVDEYIRAYSRDNCIQCLLENNIMVTVSGNGWSKFKSEYKYNLNIIDSSGIDFTNVLDIMANSKMVLNHIATHQNGTHERIFSSMLCGAICLTLDFPCIHNEFTDGENITLFSDSNLQALSDKVNNLLNSPIKAESIANQGYLIATESHTWLNNVDEILKITSIR